MLYCSCFYLEKGLLDLRNGILNSVHQNVHVTFQLFIETNILVLGQFVYFEEYIFLL
jgi:hypothetical protein